MLSAATAAARSLLSWSLTSIRKIDRRLGLRLQLCDGEYSHPSRVQSARALSARTLRALKRVERRGSFISSTYRARTGLAYLVDLLRCGQSRGNDRLGI